MILLSFDTEEFDVPREHGVDISLEEGMRVSIAGTTRILDILKANSVQATFFCTGNFAAHAPHIIQRIINEDTRWLAMVLTTGNPKMTTCFGRKKSLNAWPNSPFMATDSPACLPFPTTIFRPPAFNTIHH